MAERLEREHSSELEHNNAAELEKLARSAERDDAKIESESRRAKQLEHESEERLEKLQEKSEKTKERRAEHEQEQAEQRPEPTSKRERAVVFKKELKQIQSQLTPTQKTLSKVVHNPVVETVSQSLEETLFRPTLVLGGSIGAIVIGVLIYIVARVQGFALSGSEFIAGLLVGGLMGVVIELFGYLFAKKAE